MRKWHVSDAADRFRQIRGKSQGRSERNREDLKRGCTVHTSRPFPLQKGAHTTIAISMVMVVKVKRSLVAGGWELVVTWELPRGAGLKPKMLETMHDYWNR